MPSRTKPPVKTNYCNPAAIKTRNGVPGAAQHNPPWKAHANDDANSIADEEEVIFELDEVALSNLPLHLQNTMREIQLERVHRLQKECRQNIHLRMRSHESNRYENEKVYAERWYQNMLAKVAAARELEAQIMNEYDPSISRPEGMTWCPVRHAWVPASCGLRGTRGRARHGDTCAAGLYDLSGSRIHCTACAETAAGGGYYVSVCRGRRESSYGQYMSWRCAGPYYVYEARAEEKVRERRGQVSPEPLKRCLSLMPVVRDHVRSKIQRVKAFFQG